MTSENSAYPESPENNSPAQSDADSAFNKENSEAFEAEDVVRLQSPTGKAASICIVIIAALLILVVILRTQAYPRTDDAEVFANYIGIAPVVSGPVTELNVRDNEQVHEGDILFRIEDRPYRYALEQFESLQATLEGQIVDEDRHIQSQKSAVVAADAGSRSAVANAQRATAAVEQSEADVEHANAALDTARAEYAYSANNLHRIEALLAEKYVTVDQVDQLRTNTSAKRLAVDQATAQLKLAQAALASSHAALQAAQENISQSVAQKQQQQHAVNTLQPLVAQRGARFSAIEQARYDLDQCVVRAPFDSRVTDLVISKGAYARAGQQIFTLIDTRVWWVVANFRETQLQHIQPGMKVDVYLLGQAAAHYEGIVESVGYGVAPDASTIGQLTPGLPDVQRTLSWVHLASRYPVRIRILNPPPGVFRIAQSAAVIVRGQGQR